MIVRNCNSVLVLFTICLLFVVEIAKPDTTSSSSSSSSDGNSGKTSYSGYLNGGEIGLNITFNSAVSPRMKVVLWYDTEVDSATKFFQQQFNNDVFQGFSGCNIIDWTFYPCGTSGLDNAGKLVCPLGDAQCKFDVIHACVATLYQDKPALIGQFILCFFNNNKDVNKCTAASTSGLVQPDINNCVSSNTGATDCGAFFTKIHGAGVFPVVGPPSGQSSADFTKNFKGVLCDHIQSAKLTCTYCPPPPPNNPTSG